MYVLHLCITKVYDSVSSCFLIIFTTAAPTFLKTSKFARVNRVEIINSHFRRKNSKGESASDAIHNLPLWIRKRGIETRDVDIYQWGANDILGINVKDQPGASKTEWKCAHSSNFSEGPARSNKPFENSDKQVWHPKIEVSCATVSYAQNLGHPCIERSEKLGDDTRGIPVLLKEFGTYSKRMHGKAWSSWNQTNTSNQKFAHMILEMNIGQKTQQLFLLMNVVAMIRDKRVYKNDNNNKY